jgi:hypothetical protein
MMSYEPLLAFIPSGHILGYGNERHSWVHCPASLGFLNLRHSMWWLDFDNRRREKRASA